MKEIAKYVAIALAVIMTVGIGVYSIILTYSFSMFIFPDKVLEPALSVFLFDLGFVVWVLVFLFVSDGVVEKGTAVLMVVACLIGMTLTSLGYLLVGGQKLITVNAGWIGAAMIWIYTIWLLLHTIGGTVHVISHPKVWAMIEDQIEEIKIAQFDREQKQKERELKQQRESTRRKLNMDILRQATKIEGDFVVRNGSVVAQKMFDESMRGNNAVGVDDLLRQLHASPTTTYSASAGGGVPTLDDRDAVIRELRGEIQRLKNRPND